MKVNLLNKKFEPRMKFRRIQKKMTDLLDADGSEAEDAMKVLKFSKNQNQNMSTVVAALPTITNPTVCCGHFNCDTAL